MKVESKNKYVEIPFYLEQAIRKIIIYKARNNTARKPGDNRSGKNCIKMASCYFLATIQKKSPVSHKQNRAFQLYLVGSSLPITHRLVIPCKS